MPRRKQTLDPYLTAHEQADDWPIVRGVDERGRGVHLCVGCGEELPDGVAVERAGRSGYRAVSAASIGERTDETAHVCGGASRG